MLKVNKLVVSTQKQEIQFLIYINQIVTFSYFFKPIAFIKERK